MSTRLLHVSDTHLGNRQYGSDTRRADFADAFEQAITLAIEESVDAVIHTGDLFDSRNPGLQDLNRCLDILQELADHDIPFLGVVGNHERKMDVQYLDLIEKAGVAERLDRSPRVINDDVAIYGIDAVTKPAWHATDFTLEPPPADQYTILCMHQLLEPPVPSLFAEHETEAVLERLDIELDALALGDYHEGEGTIVDGTKVWYAGSTERCGRGERSPRTVSLLEIESGTMTRTERELDVRPFLDIEVPFAEGDGRQFLEDVLDRRAIEGRVVFVEVTGAPTSVSARDVRELVLDRGAIVCRVDDQRDGLGFDADEIDIDAVDSAGTLIESKLAERNLSEVAVEIEQQVRTGSVTKHNFDDETEKLLEERQATAFDEGEVAEEGAE